MFRDDFKLGFLSGAGGGLGQYLLNVNAADIASRMIVAIITAFLCGVIGAFGSEIVRLYIKKKVKNKL